MRKFMVGSLAVLVCAIAAMPVQGASINVGTNNGNGVNWLVDVYSSLTTKTTSGVPAIQNAVIGNYISITSNEYRTGTWIAGSNNNTFNGLWTATETVVIPTGATNLNLTLSRLLGDDRIALRVNGTEVAWYSIDCNAGGAGLVCVPTTGNHSCTYEVDPVTVDLSSYIHVGTNTLQLIVNNTGVAEAPGLTAPVNNLNSDTDSTSAYLKATLSYSTSTVPEPTTLMLIGSAAAGLIGWRARRRMV